jgi:predicted DNA-binding transcriptional regulator AlpA
MDSRSLVFTGPVKQFDLLGDDENRRCMLAASEIASSRLSLVPIQRQGNEQPAAFDFAEAGSFFRSIQRGLLKAAEVAHFLNISSRQVWRLASSGTLPGRVKLGRLTRWRRDVIEKWIAAGCPKRQR